MSSLQIRLLGQIDIREDTRALSLPPTRKSQSLLSYLIYNHNQSQSRDHLCSLFWADRPERKARRSLTTGLWHIRRCLPGDDCLLSDAQAVQFNLCQEHWLDVDEFRSLVLQTAIESIWAAVDLYKGDLLEGFYDDWVINERYRLEALLLDALTQLIAAHEQRGDFPRVLMAAYRLLEHDPLREDAYRATMRAYCALGQPDRAIMQYRRCQDNLSNEMNAEPMAKTTMLYQAIVENRLELKQPPASVESTVQVRRLQTFGSNPFDVIERNPLVGREREMRLLETIWQEASQGRGSLVLISGEAGIGKTRLAEEFASLVRWKGTRVLWGRCYEFERQLPYQPLVAALRDELPYLASGELAWVPTWALTEMARILPELRERFVDLPYLGEVQSEQQRANVVAGVCRFLCQIAMQKAVVLVLEDLHWASHSTMQLLHALVHELSDHRVMLIGTFRPELDLGEHSVPTLRRRLTREGMCSSLRLPPLSFEAVENLVASMSGAGKAVSPLAKRLYLDTEGNPFFLMETIKTLFGMGLIQMEEGVWHGDFYRISQNAIPLPSAIKEAIATRMKRLDPDTQDALRVAAVIGTEFDFDLLDSAWSRDEPITLAAIDELLRQRLIEEGAGAAGRDYTFTHPMIREVVYSSMPQRHRQRLHGQVGLIMERVHEGQTEAWIGELAFHFQQACRLDRSLVDRAVKYSLQAGDHARGLHAYQEAVAYYRQALALQKEQNFWHFFGIDGVC